MFTGLVEATGEVVSLAPTDQGTRLTINAGVLAVGAQLGDSIAINGCCLTVVGVEESCLAFDLLEETLARTSLRIAVPGAPVNLERAMPANGRYGGHFVTGHIDATGFIRCWESTGASEELRIEVDPAQTIYLVPKGCIAIDGISLTVGEVTADEFSVWIIPHTRAVTTLQARIVGDPVNLEFDLLAKYAEKILAARLPKAEN